MGLRRAVMACAFLVALLTPAVASATTGTYILGVSTGPLAYGVYGQAYCYPWPECPYGNSKHVESLYVRDSSGRFVEIGIENSYFSVDWTKDPDKPAAVFVAYEDLPTLPYRSYYKAAANPSTWIAFEVNNHQMYAPGASSWYAAWNGNTVLHGLAMPSFWNGEALGASERWISADSRSSFRYMQYKRIQGNWGGFPDTDFRDYDSLYGAEMVPGFTNRFYMAGGI